MIRFGALSVSLLGSAVLAGCSPLVDRTNSPDAPPVPPDETAPAIVSSNPPNNASNHSVIQPITVYFDEAVDPSTVTAASVKLELESVAFVPITDFPSPFGAFDPPTGAVSSPRDMVRGTVAFDEEARRLTFTPTRPLPYGATLVLTLTDLKDVAGNSLTTTLRFRTSINAIVRRTLLSNNVNNNITSIQQITVDTNGLPAKRLGVDDGADNVWFTADDRLVQRMDFVYDSNGRLQREVFFSAGVDNQYNTSDDVPFEWMPVIYDAEGKPTERLYITQPGTDGMFGTADDPLVFRVTPTFMGDRIIGTNFYNAPGPDATWRTPDDKCDAAAGFLLPGIWSYTYDASGRKTNESHANCGTDGIPRNGDDQQDISINYSYDSNGELIRVDASRTPGADAMWNTADDVRYLIHTIERDAAGNVVRTFTYTAPGPDGNWGTADDVPGDFNGFGQPLDPPFLAHTRRTYDETTKQLLELTRYTAAGGDNTWGTEDDVIETYTTFQYDNLGQRLDYRIYREGADGMWHTADDRVIEDRDFDTQH